MLRFTVSLSKFFIVLLCLLFVSIISMAAVQIIPAEGVDFQTWLADNYAVVLLAVSEILGLLPGKQSGILKIILFFLQRLAEKKTSKSKS